MSSINGYINPFSSGFHRSAENFPSLSAGSKVLTIFFSAAAFLVSLPLLGIGGFATFRSLVDRLSPIDRSHSNTVDKTATIGEKSLKSTQLAGARLSHARGCSQQKTIDKQLSNIESELKTLNEYLSSKSMQEKLDRALATKETLDNRRACLRDLATFYNAYHRKIEESLKTVELSVKNLKTRSKNKLGKRQKAIKDELGVIHADLATRQAKIAKVFTLVHSELQRDLDVKLPTLTEADLKEDEAIADFLHGMFSRINRTSGEQRDISEIQEPDTDHSTGIWPSLETSIAYFNFIEAGTQEDPKSKVHEIVVEPIGAWRKKIKDEINKREINKKRTSAALQHTASQTVSRTPSSAEGPHRLNARGLPNIGNTCYMNSSLQVILNTPSLSALIDRDIPKPVWSDFSDITLDDSVLASYLSGTAEPEETSLKCAVNKYKEAVEEYPRKISHLNALRQLKDVYEDRKKKISLRPAVSHLRKIFTGMDTRLVTLSQNFEQEDAGEFMTAVLQGIGYSLTLRKTIQGHDHDNKKYTSMKEESQTYLSIPIIVPKKGEVTFQELVDAYRSEETDDPKNAWKVTNENDEVIAECQKYTSTLSIIEKIPDTLVIQLKRFDLSGGYFRKINSLVEIGEEVDMRSMIDSSLLGEDPSTRYRVKGVIVHDGSTNGGHYTADVEIDDKWQLCNDSHVNKNLKANSIAQRRKRGYMYVLERIK